MRNKGFDFGVSNTENENGDRVQFFDFSINGEMVHHSFYSSRSLTNVFIDIAKGKNDFEILKNQLQNAKTDIFAAISDTQNQAKTSVEDLKSSFETVISDNVPEPVYIKGITVI